MKQEETLQEPVQGDALMKTQHKLAQTKNGAKNTQPINAKSAIGNDAANKHNQQPQDQSFLNILLPILTLFHTFCGEAYASIQEGNRILNMQLEDIKFRLYVAQLFFETTGTAIKQGYFKELLEHCIALALFKGPELNVHVRLAEHKGNLYVDLCDEEYRVVKITPEGSEVIRSLDCPVYFIRTPRMQALPLPEQGGSFKPMLKLLNIKGIDQQVLTLSWLLGAMMPNGPYPILVLEGEQGSGKSSASRLLRDLIDPASPAISSMPTSERNLVILASKLRLLVFDNLSKISDCMSDALCRLSTGGGFSARTLFTNASETVFDLILPMIVNGITSIFTRADLIDRSLYIFTSPIPKSERRPEKELKQDWENIKPGVLGALYSAVACALKNIKDTKLDSHPRMADYAQWVVSAEPAMPWKPGEFMKAYDQNRSVMIDHAIESDLVASEIKRLVETNGEFSGTSTELLTALNQSAPENKKRDRTWPKLPNALSRQLRRNATFLRERNIDIQTSKSGIRNITIQILDNDDFDTPPEVADDEFGPMSKADRIKLHQKALSGAPHIPKAIREEAQRMEKGMA